MNEGSRLASPSALRRLEMLTPKMLSSVNASGQIRAATSASSRAFRHHARAWQGRSSAFGAGCIDVPPRDTRRSPMSSVKFAEPGAFPGAHRCSANLNKTFGTAGCLLRYCSRQRGIAMNHIQANILAHEEQLTNASRGLGRHALETAFVLNAEQVAAIAG